MTAVSQSLADKRHAKAELEHLREFYLTWAQMHMTIGSTTADIEAKRQAAQSLVDKAQVLREFYS